MARTCGIYLLAFRHSGTNVTAARIDSELSPGAGFFVPGGGRGKKRKTAGKLELQFSHKGPVRERQY